MPVGTLLTAAALASPRFVAAEPNDARVAAEAWQAAIACTGWEAAAHDVVQVERGNVRKGFLGLASTDERGLWRIELDGDDERLNEVIVHEVAHAWVQRGPTALVEGRAELLADCIVHHSPGLAPLQWDDGRELVGMPDLRSWRSTDDHGPSVNPMMRTDAYLGAARLVRLAALVLPERALWPADDRVDWDGLDGLLAGAGQPGERLREILRADAETQRRALSDVDHDGLPLVGERMLGTDPYRFDSDEDGWWDGAEVPADAVPLPFDGTPRCTGLAAGPRGGTARLRTGGNLRGTPAPAPVLRVAHAVFADGRVAVAGQGSILVELDGDPEVVSGGLWARVDGEGLVADEACADHDRYVAWAAEPRFRHLIPGLGAALASAIARGDERLGPAPARVAVALGGSTTTVDGPVVRIGAPEVERLLEAGGLDAIAGQAVAMRRVWDTSTTVREWRDVEALSARLRPSGPPLRTDGTAGGR